MDLEISNKILEEFNISDGADPNTANGLNLAYIGDAVYELIIRTIIVRKSDQAVNKYHTRATKLVNASAQKDIMKRIEPLLSDEEMAVFKRGRNSKSYSIPKNQSPSDYRNATGFEALIGYLYLKNRFDRILELIKAGIDESLI